jgi:hypothetical protein
VMRTHRATFEDGGLLLAPFTKRWTSRLAADLRKSTCGLCGRSTDEIDFFIVSPLCLHGACNRCYPRVADACPAGSYCATRSNLATSVGLPESSVAIYFDPSDQADRFDADADADADAVAVAVGVGVADRHRDRDANTDADRWHDVACVTCTSALEGDAILRSTLRSLLCGRGPTRFTHRVDATFPISSRVFGRIGARDGGIYVGPIPVCVSCQENATCTPEMIDVALGFTPDIGPVTPTSMARARLVASVQRASARVVHSDSPGALDGLLSSSGQTGMVDALRCLLGFGRIGHGIGEMDDLLLNANLASIQIFTLNTALVSMAYIRATATLNISCAASSAIERMCVMTWAIIALLSTWGGDSVARMKATQLAYSADQRRESAVACFRRMLAENSIGVTDTIDGFRKAIVGEFPHLLSRSPIGGGRSLADEGQLRLDSTGGGGWWGSSPSLVGHHTGRDCHRINRYDALWCHYVEFLLGAFFVGGTTRVNEISHKRRRK